MTQPDQMDLLRRMVTQHGQANVARRIKKSAAAVCSVLSGNYQGKPDNILRLIEEAYGSTTVICPLLGEITLGKCAANRALPHIIVNPARVELWTACRECEEKS